jgi:hypothetical protein
LYIKEAVSLGLAPHMPGAPPPAVMTTGVTSDTAMGPPGAGLSLVRTTSLACAAVRGGVGGGPQSWTSRVVTGIDLQW